jgi:hypothetical protein
MEQRAIPTKEEVARAAALDALQDPRAGSVCFENVSRETFDACREPVEFEACPVCGYHVRQKTA